MKTISILLVGDEVSKGIPFISFKLATTWSKEVEACINQIKKIEKLTSNDLIVVVSPYGDVMNQERKLVNFAGLFVSSKTFQEESNVIFADLESNPTNAMNLPTNYLLGWDDGGVWFN